jgi:protein-tyrosine phosphatase
MNDERGRSVRRDAGFAQVFNLRDLGGLPTEDGRRVRRGRLFRSDSPHRATPEDVERLRSLGLRLVIDLRQAAERDAFGVAAEDVAARHHHLPVFDVSSGGGRQAVTGSIRADMEAAFERDGQAGEYLYMLEHGAPTFVGALEAIAGPDGLPALFHCAVGKDRTGVLAACALTLLGVPAGEVAADYARTEPGMLALTEWAEQHEPVYGHDLRTATPGDGTWTRPGTMLRFLDLVGQRHGSIGAFLRDAGLPDEVPARLAALLLEG